MFFDFLGASCSLISTYFFIRLNQKAWIVGILAIFLNSWLYWSKGIYADMTLEGCYFLSMIYGWYKWKSPSHSTNQTVQIKQLSQQQLFLLFILFNLVFLLIYFLLLFFTNSSVPILDAATTSLSLVAQWLMCHKIILTWVLWFITDSLYAVMYLNKNLPFHTLLMIIYTGMAIVGYVTWTRSKLYKAI